MKKETNRVIAMLALVGQIGISMLVPICICTYLGYLLGNHFGISWLSVIAFFVGALAGFRSVFQIIHKYLKQNKDESIKKTK